MRTQIDWSSWILQKNNEAKQDRLHNTDSLLLDKTDNSPYAHKNSVHKVWRIENRRKQGPFNDSAIEQKIPNFRKYYEKFNPMNEFSSESLKSLYDVTPDPKTPKERFGYVGRHSDGTHFRRKDMDPENAVFAFVSPEQAASFVHPDHLKIMNDLGYSLREKSIKGVLHQGKNQVMVDMGPGKSYFFDD